MRLIEHSTFSEYQLQEDAKGLPAGVLMVVSGVFGRRDQKNINNRIYPTQVWAKTLREDSPVMQTIKERGFWGELDHPDDGQTRFRRTSHLVTHLGLGEGNAIVGRAEIVDTASGRDLLGLFRAKGRVGTSSRGEGDVITEGGVDIVQENFELQAFDFVHNPSTAGAFPKAIAEGASRSYRNGDKLMDLMEEYKALEEAVLELASLKPAEIPPVLRPLIEKQATETMQRLSKIVEESGVHKPLFLGLLSEAQGIRRGLVFPTKTIVEYDEPTPKLLDKLQGGLNTAKPGEKGSVEPLPDTAPKPPDIPGSEPVGTPMKTEEEIKMAETAKNAKGFNKTLHALVREAEDAIVGDKEEDSEKLATEVAKRCESRILKLTKKLAEDDGLMPGAYEAPSLSDKSDEVTAEGEDGDEDDPFKKDEPPAFPQESDTAVEIPDPPKDLAVEGDEDEDPMKDDEGQPLPPMEAKLVKTLRKLVRENRMLRYEQKVSEAISAHAIAQLTKRVRFAESRRRAPSAITISGQRIPLAKVPAVVEAIVARYRKLKESAAPKDEPTGTLLEDGPITASLRTARLRDAKKLTESLPAGRPRGADTKRDPLMEAAEMSAAINARMFGGGQN